MPTLYVPDYLPLDEAIAQVKQAGLIRFNWRNTFLKVKV